MEKKKIIINIILSLFLLLLIGTFLPMNMIPFLAVLAILILYNIGTIKFITPKIRIIISLALCLIVTIYIVVPKKITGCSNLADGSICSSINCVGIPYLNGIPPSPECFGKSWPVVDVPYAADQYCDHNANWNACSGYIIKISGTNPDAGAGIAQHPIVAMPAQYQSYLDTENGQIILISDEEINCPNKMTVIGKLTIDVGPCNADSPGKSMYCGSSITVDEWECPD